jgi:hypothetical protein
MTTYFKGQQAYLLTGNGIRLNAPTVYRTVGPITYSDKSANYSGYPTYGKYICTNAVLASTSKTGTKEGWSRLRGEELYWDPYDTRGKNYTPYISGKVFKLYTPGDENQYWPPPEPQIDLFTIPGVSPVSTSVGISKTITGIYVPSAFGTSVPYASSTYRATNTYAEWADIKTFTVNLNTMAANNPYSSLRTQLWVKFDTATNSTIGNIYYWYNPLTRQFLGVPTSIKIYDSATASSSTTQSVDEGKIQSLVLQGKNRAQAISSLTAPSAGGNGSPASNSGAGNNSAVTNQNGSSTQNASTQTTANAPIKATVRVRGNFGYINPGEPDGGAPQMVQYYRQGTSPLQEPDRHIFSPKPNEINYQNLGSEWTEIERVGRIPLVDWKNFRLMKISFQFLVLPDTTYRMGAYGQSAEDGITLSIDSKLDTLRNMATRPYPVILFGFDELLTNSSQFSNSAGSGVQFVIQDFSISSMMRTATGAINRATCDITLQEVPIEYINLITMPRLVPGQILAPRDSSTETPFGGRETVTENLPPRDPFEITKGT